MGTRHWSGRLTLLRVQGTRRFSYLRVVHGVRRRHSRRQPVQVHSLATPSLFRLTGTWHWLVRLPLLRVQGTRRCIGSRTVHGVQRRHSRRQPVHMHSLATPSLFRLTGTHHWLGRPVLSTQQFTDLLTVRGVRIRHSRRQPMQVHCLATPSLFRLTGTQHWSGRFLILQMTDTQRYF